jgi:hypothetical protein
MADKATLGVRVLSALTARGPLSLGELRNHAYVDDSEPLVSMLVVLRKSGRIVSHGAGEECLWAINLCTLQELVLSPGSTKLLEQINSTLERIADAVEAHNPGRFVGVAQFDAGPYYENTEKPSTYPATPPSYHWDCSCCGESVNSTCPGDCPRCGAAGPDWERVSAEGNRSK